MFLSPYSAHVEDAASSFCTSSNIVGAVLSELESSAAGGKQEFVNAILGMTMLAILPPGPDGTRLLPLELVTHPKAAVLLTCYCDKIRTGDLPGSGYEMLSQIARFCERHDHPAGGYGSLQSMLGEQEGLIDAVLAQIGENEASRMPAALMYRLLGYCAISCTDDDLPRIAKGAAGAKSDREFDYGFGAIMHESGDFELDGFTIATTIATRALSMDPPKLDLIFAPMAHVLHVKQVDLTSFASLLNILDDRIDSINFGWVTMVRRSPAHHAQLFLERLQALSLALSEFVERERIAQETAQNAARAAEDSLLAELDAEEAEKGKKKQKKKKKKKKKSSGKRGEGGEQAESADGLTDVQRYEQSETKREVDRRKRERNLEEAAKVMAAHAKKTQAATAAAVEARIAALELPLSETAEDIEAQIAALGPPPDFPPAPPPTAAPDAFLESLLAAPPPGKSLKETAAELLSLMFGTEPPPGATLLAVLEKLEGEFGYVGTGAAVERINKVKEQVGV
jgi:hypothetical protein